MRTVQPYPMPTSRRRVVTHRNRSPPTAHWRRTVETWSFIARTAGSGGSTDDGELAGCLVEALRAGLGGDHDVLDAGAAAAREVDAGLDREGVTGRQRGGVARHEVGVLVLLEADAVARPVDEVV